MRTWLALVPGMATLAVGALAVACAASDDEANVPDTPRNEAVIPDASTTENDGDASLDADASGSPCSTDGWCRTVLPDADLVLVDIWTFPARAFAIAQSPTLGVKVLEWREADATWGYIDDSTQNEYGLGAYAGSIWAPSEDEVYYAVAPGYVYHGTRPTPGAAWTWTRQQLGDNGRPGMLGGWEHGYHAGSRFLALGVWGSSKSDVYAWFKNTIYRRSSDGGTSEWVPEYVADDFDDENEHLFFTSGAGAGPGDVWFAGSRTRYSSACAVLVRKTVDGYARIADGTISDAECTPRAEIPMVGGGVGRLADLQSVGGGKLVALKGARDLVKIATSGDGYDVDVAAAPASAVGLTDAERFLSLWSGADAVWLTANGLVIRGADPWAGGAYEISSIALRGSPITKDIHRVRGTSQTNLWAIGDRIALHKTAP